MLGTMAKKVLNAESVSLNEWWMLVTHTGLWAATGKPWLSSDN